MRIEFRYPGVKPVEIPAANLRGLLKPKSVPDAPASEETVARALAEPIGAAALSEAARGAKSAVIIVDDATRLTPAKVALPFLVEQLGAAGVAEEAITLLVGGGTHRGMNRTEQEWKIGDEILRRHKVLIHDWADKKQLTSLGELADGTPVVVSKALVETDFAIGVGHIVPHRILGYSGGAKIVLPGVAGEESVDHMHWTAAHYPSEELFGRFENPIRGMVDAFGERAGLKYIVNFIQDDEERVVGAVAGDPVAAHRAGCEKSREIYEIQLPELTDIGITDSYPADRDLWQSIKGFYSMERAVKQDGVMIVVTPSPEGIAHGHAALGEYGFQTLPEVQALIAEGKVKPNAAAAAMVYGGRAAKMHATGIIVSEGIKRKEAERIGLAWAETAQEALEKAFAIRGKEASVMAFHHGGEIFPCVST